MSSPSASGATKRPLEDPSSPNVKDEHDSKRPALEKEETEEAQEAEAKEESPVPVTAEEEEKTTTGQGEEAHAEQPKEDVDTVVPDEHEQDHHDHDQHSAPVDETQWIHIRSLITSAEAATVIGKGGENVTQIRKMAEAKCTVSDYQRGAGERILTVSGAVDAVAKVNPAASLMRYHPLTYPGLWSNHPHSQQRTSR